LVCTSLPIAEFVKLRCCELGIATLGFIEQFIILLIWTLDMVVRTLPIIYETVFSTIFEMKHTWFYSGDYDRWSLVDVWVPVMIIAVYIAVGCVFFVLTLQHGKTRTVLRILKIVALAVMLSFTSHPKLSNVGWKSGVETFIRFSISIILAIHLHSRNIIELWQVCLFSTLTILCGCLQIYFFSRVNDGHYEGYRICPGMKREENNELPCLLEMEKCEKTDNIILNDLEEQPGFGMYKGRNKETPINMEMNKSENAGNILRGVRIIL